ncbi:hypothetical protein IV417_16390 [Alphaproteobacteria bacterium KMM 3653]|uniref:Lecithin:cholesterol acyltransferase n=1 Tax=Harenicola maris TaxID=2841044 RepID=A0AAP2CTF9_9RHOB|nr:hypothetical protein [Harenicola maris]
MSGEAVGGCIQNIVAPVIFIPGIMGSRLSLEDGTIIWNPGSDGWEQASNAAGLARRFAAGKRSRLVGDPTQYFDRRRLKVAHRNDGGLADRGWAGMLPSYQPFMAHLNGERHGYVNDCLVMTRVVLWCYPYNWTASNLDSARHPQNNEYGNLETVVGLATEHAEALARELDRQAVKPVIITHSMGGLVSRAFTNILGKSDMVHGVIHGAMPTHGAPELYKRMKGGFEGPTSVVLGRSGAEVTATAGNCPGPLELAPNQWHQGADGRRDWLGAVDINGGAIPLPRSDPYSEIYENETDYWRLIDKPLLNPAGLQGEEADYNQYLRQIRTARSFHQQLGRDGFHPNTRMFYGTGLTTRDRVDWSIIERMGGPHAGGTFTGGTSYTESEDSMGVSTAPREGVAVSWTRIGMSGPNAPGDGTVQAGAGSYAGQMAEPVTDGFEHQGAFDSRAARELTLQWFGEMVEEMVGSA